MPYDRESLSELNRRLALELVPDGSSPTLRRALYTPFARALAGAVFGVHDHLDWRTRQLFPQTCDDDILESLHADLWLQGDTRNPAVSAQGSATARGTAGTVIPKETVFNRNDGAQFLSLYGVTIGSNDTVDVPLAAAEAGTAGNTAAGDALYLANPVAGVETTATVVSLAGGTDIETVAELRTRIIESRKLGGEVGKTADWVRWAKEVSGVTRAWAVPKMSGAGTVTVYFVRDNDADIYPDAGAVADVQQHLEHSALPFGEIYAVSPGAHTVDFSIKVEPDTAEVRDAVYASLKAVVENNVSPVAYDDSGDPVLPVTGDRVLISHIRQAVSNAAGEYDHVVHSPTADIQLGIGELAVMGSIEWIS